MIAVESKHETTLKYRPDINGLRAIAVLSVISFHLGAPFAPGGFVGVDIFFVISGYLITKILVFEIDSGNYSLPAFYARRIRRIIPALLAMLFIVSVFGYFVIIPVNYVRFSDSAAAAALSISNIYFYKHSGYFDLGADYVPLLHTWSLGVEEQFYLIFPLVFSFCRYSLRIPWKWTILPVLIISLIFGAIQSELSIKALLMGTIKYQADGNGAFYLPMSRSWEFLTGSVIAVGAAPLLNGHIMVRQALSLIGSMMILYSVVAFNGSTKFPMFAVVPCLGTALLIYSNTQSSTFIGNLLSATPMAEIGVVSYSLYLWHWPLIVFARLVWGGEQSALGYFLLFVAMLALAWLSWRFIETPVRNDGRLFTQHRLFAGVGIGAFFFLSVAGIVNKLSGMPTRFSPSALAIADSAKEDFPLSEACDGKSGQEITAGSVCEIGRVGSPLSFALIGDSFANAISPGVEDAAIRSGRRGIAMTHGGCYALVGAIWGDSDARCKEFLDAAISKLKLTSSIDTVILVSRWSAAAEGSRFGGINLNRLFITDDKSAEQSYEENKRVFVRSLKRTADALSGYKVFVVAYLPEQSTYVPQTAALRVQFGFSDTGTARGVVDRRQANARQLLTVAASNYGFTVLDAMTALCDTKTCRAIEDGKSLYRDDNHLSRFGALKESALLDAAFQ